MICLPGTATLVFSPGGHGDGALIEELTRCAAAIDTLTRESMLTVQEAAALSQFKRDQRSLNEP